jgi:ribosomal protein L16 Arg81 hydroxylase
LHPHRPVERSLSDLKMRYKIGIYSPNVVLYLAGVDRHFSDDECSGAIAYRDSVGRRRAGAD